MTRFDALPPGHYASEVFSDEEDPVTLGFKVIGHQVIEKSKRGRIRQWARPQPGVDWQEFRDSESSTAQLVEEFADDPEYHMAIYGSEFGRCGCCNRPLSDPLSRKRGIGPECIQRVAQVIA